MRPAATGDSRRAIGLLRVQRNPANIESQSNFAGHPVSGGLAPKQETSNDEKTATIRVQILGVNELVCDGVRRSLSKVEGLEVIGTSDGITQSPKAAGVSADVTVLLAGETLEADLAQIGAIRKHAPVARILLLGGARGDAEFLQYVRAGISGFLWRDASMEDLTRAVKNVHAGEAVCPGELCAALFRFFEDAEPRLAFGSPTQRLGLTRREQQIVPLIAKGLTNKEIANHFCLSEQTVKNHLYRMKHKVGAEDRLSIVQKFRHQGLLL